MTAAPLPSMTLPRSQLVEILAASLPVEWDVLPLDNDPDAITDTTVIVRIADAVPAPEMPHGVRRYTFSCVVAVPQLDTSTAALVLDDALEQLLYVVDRAELIQWTRAQRGILAGPEVPCYDVAVTVTATQETA